MYYWSVVLFFFRQDATALQYVGHNVLIVMMLENVITLHTFKSEADVRVLSVMLQCSKYHEDLVVLGSMITGISSDCFVSMAKGSYFGGTVLLSSLGTLPRATYDMSLHFCSQRVWRSEPPFCCFPKIIGKQRYISRCFVYWTTRILCLWLFV